MLKTQLIKQKDYSDKMYSRNQQLETQMLQLKTLSYEASRVGNGRNVEKEEVVRLRTELGQKNVELASLRVDIEKGELEYKKRCEVLQSDLEYEKSNSARLTQEIRRYQSSASNLDSTMQVQPSAKSAVQSSVREVGSPVWSSGSGALKEIQLHNAEVRLKTLEKENKTLKEHEEFYINKGREWKSRALKYEKVLEKNEIVVPGKEPKECDVNSEGKENSDSVTEESKENDASTQEMSAGANASATSNLDLMLNRRDSKAMRDFRKPDARSATNKNDCQTQ